MKVNLTQDEIRKLRRRDADVYDLKCPGLVLRTRASGRHTWRVLLGYGKWLSIGRVDALPPEKARELARAAVVSMADGHDPIADKRKKTATTFADFLTDHYEPWAVANLKHHGALLARIHAQFDDLFGAKPITEITPWAVEAWRSGRLKTVRKATGKAVTKATANRDLAALKACLSKAVTWNLIPDHPLRRVKLSKEDRSATVRFLTPAEEARLRAALTARDDTRRKARSSANDWRRQRGYPLLADYGVYTDHLSPFVLLAMNTGCRRGELFNLTWADVDLTNRLMTVRGEGAKSGRTRHIPLNTEAHQVLKDWQTGAVADLVFPNDESGAKMTTLKTAWSSLLTAADIKDFRLHDLRHHFASRLVQAGVDLASVRALLGHSDFALTLRYAHLAPENLSAAVAKLNSPPVTVPGVQPPAAMMMTALPLAMKPGTMRP